jgi:general secretion pathway protein E
VTRLLDMGVEPYLISSVLNAILAQRLVRRLCAECREPYAPQPEALSALGLSVENRGSVRFFRPVGCPACRGTGFRGRLALLEFLPMSEPIARLALARAEAREIARVAVAEGMRTIFDDGLAKARAGETTIEEVLRVTQEGP